MVDSSQERAAGRELALLVMCHLESYSRDEAAEAIELLWNNPPSGEGSTLQALMADRGARTFAQQLLERLLEQRDRLDELIGAVSRSWRLERMDRVDRNLLRLAALELGRHGGTPRAVVLAETVRLAARYGGERSAPFVNGVVEALARRLRPAADGDADVGS